MVIYCDKCEEYMTCFHETKKGKRYCWKCWEGILDWIKTQNKVGGCTLCGEDNITWEDNNIWINFQTLKLCANCYNEIYGIKIPIVMRCRNG